MICGACQNVFGQPFTETDSAWEAGGRYYYDYQRTVQFDDLARSSTTCHICRGFLREWQTVNNDGNSVGLSSVMHYSLQIPKNDKIKSLLIVSSGEERPSLQIRFMVEQLQEHELTTRSSPGISSTGSREALEFARDCIRTCDRTHSVCKSRREDRQWWPTRLIDLSPSYDDDDPDYIRARLILTAEHKLTQPYASLSYCWGQAKTLKLLGTNMSALTQEIPTDELPETFRDAFRALKYLGMKYVWIDSLCIIQDSPEDWRREAALMQHVYLSASLNIAASHGADSHAGLFHERDLEPANSVLKVNNTHMHGMFRFLDSNIWADLVNLAPLNRRGWVVQERLLSPRILHFTQEQIIWDCPELAMCELHPLPLGPTGGRDRDYIAPKGALDIREPLIGSDDILDKWAVAVHAYSSSKLTFQNDKNVAISGLAQFFQSRANNEYCAGLWRDGIEFQLAWYENYETQSKPRVPDLGGHPAPSWSWLALDRPVRCPLPKGYEGYNRRSLAQVYDVSVRETPNESSQGNIVTGSIRLRTALTPVHLVDGEATIGSSTSRPFEPESVARMTCSFEYTKPEGQQLFYIPLWFISYQRGLDPDSGDAVEVHGLIIRPVAESPGSFIRCGHAVVFGRLEGPFRDLENYMEAIEAAREPQSSLCEEFVPTLGHTIRLV